MPPDHNELLLGDSHSHRPRDGGPLRIGIGGPVGSGKTALVAAAHVSTVEARLGPDAELRLTERVVLGRAAEGPGRWTGTVRISRDGPLLHTTQELGPGAAGWAPPFTPRAYATELVLDGGTADPAVGADAVRLPLPGGWTATAWAGHLDAALAGLAGLAGTDALAAASR